MADNFKDLKKELQELRREYERIAKKPAATFNIKNIKDAKAAIEIMGEAVDRARANALRLSEGFIGIRQDIEVMIEGMNSTDVTIKKATRSIRKYQSITEKLQSDQLGISRLNLKELKTLEKKQKEELAYIKIKAEELMLEKNITDLSDEALKNAQNLTDEEKDLLVAKREGFKQLEASREQTKARLKEEKEIVKTIGITGAAFKGISGTLSKIGIESEALHDIQEDIYDTAERTGDSFLVMKSAASGILNALKDSLSDPLVQLAIFAKVFKTLIDIGSHVSDKTATIARDLGVSSDEAFDFYKQMKGVATSSAETAVTLKSVLEANNQLNQSLGTSVVFSKQQLETQTALTQRAGLSAETAAKVLDLSLAQGKSQKEIVDGIRMQGDGLISANSVLEEIVNANGQLGFNYRKNTEQLSKSVFEAKRLGINLEDAKGISSSLLDFESSIANELEAELLTGKDLNLERARQLALQGKSVEAAIEIRKQVGSAAEFGRMNVIQQEAVAKAAGMTVDQLANSLRTEEKLRAIAKDKGIRYSEQVELDKQRLSAMESINNSVENIKTTFQSVVAGPLAQMLEGVASTFNKIESNPIMRGIIKFLGAGVSIAAAVGSVMLLGRTIIKTFRGRPSGRPGDEVNTRDVSGGGAGGALDTMGKSTFGKGAFGRIGSKKGRAVLSRAVRMGKGGVLAKAALGTSNVLSKGKGLIGGVASKVAGGVGKIGSKIGGKGLAKIAGKFAGKGALKRIPILGSVVGLGYAVDRAIKGDFAGAAMEVGSAGLGLLDLVVPGLGTGLSLAADAGIAARDLKKAGTITPTAKPMATGGIVTQPTNALVGEAGSEAVIPLNEFYRKFDELIAAVRSGGDVYLDSTKVGTAMAVGTYKVQ